MSVTQAKIVAYSDPRVPEEYRAIVVAGQPIDGHVEKWVKALASKGLQPKVTPLQDVAAEDAMAEVRNIATKLQAAGHSIMNLTAQKRYGSLNVPAELFEQFKQEVMLAHGTTKGTLLQEGAAAIRNHIKILRRKPRA